MRFDRSRCNRERAHREFSRFRGEGVGIPFVVHRVPWFVPRPKANGVVVRPRRQDVPQWVKRNGPQAGVMRTMDLCQTLLEPDLPVLHTSVAASGDENIVVHRMEIHARNLLLVCPDSADLFVCSKIPDLNVLVSRPSHEVVLLRGMPLHRVHAVLMRPKRSQHLTALRTPQPRGGVLATAHDKRFEGMPCARPDVPTMSLEGDLLHTPREVPQFQRGVV